MIDANIIVVGGGCAGMQLINALLKLPAEQTGDILLIESNQSVINKSWCFWTNKQSEYDFLVEKHWSELEFRSPSSDLSGIISPYRYNYINSEKFFEYHKQLIAHSSRVRVVSEEVVKFKSDKEIKQVYTLNNQYAARHVYNSTFDHSFIDSTKILLWQHFKGWFIKTDQEVFKSDQATIMDFNIEQDQAVHFMYVLPFSKTEALVEFTSFSALDCYSDQIYDSYLRNYISVKFNCPYEIIREEKGKIPMTDFNFPTQDKEGIIQIGSAGGAIKPSTGYAFKRISRQTEYLIECFLNNNESMNNVNTSGRFHFYDTLLLQIIRNQPKKVSMIMNQLFVQNSFQKILSFLDENSTLFEELSLFSTLPKRLFLKQVLHYVHAKL
ncbi:MAG: lycopene cyclase family protein [Sphingobacterium thalpophilum]|jgi:lycopene beta-cyclase